MGIDLYGNKNNSSIPKKLDNSARQDKYRQHNAKD